jgi:hypothetical protein
MGTIAEQDLESGDQPISGALVAMICFAASP